MDKIVVLDFGSQYSHLICRRIREFSVYAELVPFDLSLEDLKKINPKGIIFAGGPASVYNSDSPRPQKGIFDLPPRGSSPPSSAGWRGAPRSRSGRRGSAAPGRPGEPAPG